MNSPHYVRRHLRFGWWSLALFACAGVALEAMHGFKVSWFLGVGDETRRLLWRLAHAHGTFLALLHIVFAASLRSCPGEATRGARLASPALCGASIALPAGFFLGGVNLHGGDPGVGIFVVPVGALLLILALLGAALDATQRTRDAA